MSSFFEKMKKKRGPYIIAELGSNHNGDMEIAKKLITTAKKAGADCVKFQSWSKETVFSKVKYQENFFLDDDYRNRNDYTLEEIVEEYSISEKELYRMKIFSDENKIDCISTPFSEGDVDFLIDKFNTPFIKIASMDLNNHTFLNYVAKKGKPIVISIGLSSLDEIDKAIRIIEEAGNKQIIILHCISIYPPKDKQVNLKRIDTLKILYPEYPIGFSDHTIGTSIPIASVVKEPCIIEKHFTLDKNMPGWDHKISADPSELETICRESKRVFHALGNGRIVCVEDEERINEFRRSIVANKRLKKNSIIKETDITFKRPGRGIRPDESKYVIGRKLKHYIEKDNLILWKDLA